MSTPLKILVLSFYYPPDISAGAFRTEALVAALTRQLPAGSEVDVVTTAPNRFGSGEGPPLPEIETGGGVSIHRLTVAGGGRGMAGQARAFVSYARQVIRVVRYQRYDIVVATSSRLVTSVLGRRVADHCHAKLYQDIRDNFVENLPYVLPLHAGWWLRPFFALAERWALGPAAHINLVSRGFAPYFAHRYPKAQFTYHTNGIDLPFVEALEQGMFAPQVPAEPAATPVQVLYAGNLGASQGIEHIVPALAERLAGQVHFRVIGGGGGAQVLQQEVTQRELTNVCVEPPMSRAKLLEAYQQADVLFLHLNTLPSLHSVLPSKLFEYAATGKPIWAGLPGYSARFVADEIENASLFTPRCVESAVAALGKLVLATHPRPLFVAHWRRDRIMDEMVNEMLRLKHGG